MATTKEIYITTLSEFIKELQIIEAEGFGDCEVLIPEGELVHYMWPQLVTIASNGRGKGRRIEIC